MFQVRASVAGFLGNIEVYPCHFQHAVDDEVIFDGATFHGRFCPDVWKLVIPKMIALHQAGPRYVEWASYCPFWYCGNSVADPGRAEIRRSRVQERPGDHQPTRARHGGPRSAGSFRLAAERDRGHSRTTRSHLP